jgi:serine/threonine-protein kinase
MVKLIQKFEGREIGGYTLVEKLGEGRYGRSFLAVDDCGKKVVIKEFKPGLFGKNRRNPDEAVVLSRLSHPGIPQLLGVINICGFYGYVLEYMEGKTLESIIFREKRVFNREEFYDIGKRLIEITAYLHKNGVVHRDIRIPNIIMQDGIVKLIDFGLARFIDNEKYRAETDFSYIGDCLLYILYTGYNSDGKKRKPWYGELELKGKELDFLKRMMGIAPIYKDVEEILAEFTHAFEILE